MKQSPKIPIEIVVPQSTIFSEHPAVVNRQERPASKRAVVDAQAISLWTDEAQQAFVGFTSVPQPTKVSTQRTRVRENRVSSTIDHFDGWDRAYPEVIDKIMIAIGIQRNKGVSSRFNNEHSYANNTTRRGFDVARPSEHRHADLS